MSIQTRGNGSCKQSSRFAANLNRLGLRNEDFNSRAFSYLRFYREIALDDAYPFADNGWGSSPGIQLRL